MNCWEVKCSHEPGALDGLNHCAQTCGLGYGPWLCYSAVNSHRGIICSSNFHTFNKWWRRGKGAGKNIHIPPSIGCWHPLLIRCTPCLVPGGLSTQAGSLSVHKVLPAWHSEFPGVHNLSSGPAPPGHPESARGLSAWTQPQPGFLQSWPRPWGSISFSPPLLLLGPKSHWAAGNKAHFSGPLGAPTLWCPFPAPHCSGSTPCSSFPCSLFNGILSCLRSGLGFLDSKSEKDSFACFLLFHFCPGPDWQEKDEPRDKNQREGGKGRY